jgi:hypothetical protein
VCLNAAGALGLVADPWLPQPGDLAEQSARSPSVSWYSFAVRTSASPAAAAAAEDRDEQVPSVVELPAERDRKR